MAFQSITIHQHFDLWAVYLTSLCFRQIQPWRLNSQEAQYSEGEMVRRSSHVGAYDLRAEAKYGLETILDEALVWINWDRCSEIFILIGRGLVGAFARMQNWLLIGLLIRI